MTPAVYYTIARYIIAWACGLLVQRGWAVANLDGATLDAVAQLVVGIIGALAMGGIGALTSTVRWSLTRLKRHHAPALLHAANEVVGSDPGLAAAAAIASSKGVL